MKNRYIILILICITLIVGCKKDRVADELTTPVQNVVITMNLYGNNSSTRSNTPYSIQNGVLGSAEYIIDRLRVYVFNSEGSLDKMITYDNLNANHLINKEIEAPKDSSKELYFIANEPETKAISDKLNNITSADELEQIEFTFAEEMNKGFNAEATFSSVDFLIPMSAKYSIMNAQMDLNIYVGLTRAVARVDLLLSKGDSAASRTIELDDSSTKLKANNISHNSTLFAKDIKEANSFQDVAVASSDVTLTTSNNQRVFSAYIAERKYSSSNRITIEVEGLIEDGKKLGTKSITLGNKNDLTEITRNHVYQIYGSYEASEIVAEDLIIMDWEDVEVDAEIEGVMLAVDNEVAMDWLRNGNTYASKSISFGSNKPIQFYLPVSVSNESDPIPDFEFKLFEFDGMSKSYDLKSIALPNNYIHTTSWIKSATIHFTSSKSGYINFVYAPTKVSYNVQKYPIRIKSDNVIKQMEAVYDNGYLPATLLSKDWADRAPGGVVFAKRGEANHPLSTPEILDRDNDGYYRGEYKATAEDGTKYCKTKFGDDWYMPSYADMQEIATMFDMLGVSYRFQNNGAANKSGSLTESVYWTSSASNEYPGKYWSADFMQREYMNDNLMERRDGTEKHYVRCVMDLQ